MTEFDSIERFDPEQTGRLDDGSFDVLIRARIRITDEIERRWRWTNEDGVTDADSILGMGIAQGLVQNDPTIAVDWAIVRIGSHEYGYNPSLGEPDDVE